MTRQALLAAAAAFAMIATPALAERGHSSEAASTETAMAPTQATPAADAKAEKKTCRTYQNTVSRMKSERLCLTKEEWRKFEDQQ